MRCGGQTHRDFKLALLTVAEQTSLAVENLSQAGTFGGFVGGRGAMGTALGVLPPGPGLWHAGLGGEATILKNREARVDRIALIAAPQASPSPAGLAPSGHVLTHQFHPTARRRKFAGQNIHKRGFTGAIGADDCMNAATGNLQ